MTPAPAALQRLNRLLATESVRFAAYQELPEALLQAVPSLRALPYKSRQLALDGPRYRWLLQCLGSRREFSVVEIGANLGFFSLSLAADRDARATLYEPIGPYVETVGLLADLAGLSGRVVCHASGVGIDDLETLPEADLLISLNVLHHAGTVFDVAAVEAANGWRAYAERWLAAASFKYRMLFLQTGNKSTGPALFDSAEAVPFVRGMLTGAGWTIDAVGAIGDFRELRFDTWTADRIDDVPATVCRRNPETGLVDYRRDGVIVASLPKGLAQRPLWFCRSRNRT